MLKSLNFLPVGLVSNKYLHDRDSYVTLILLTNPEIYFLQNWPVESVNNRKFYCSLFYQCEKKIRILPQERDM